MDTIGKRFKEIRATLRLTQEAMAEKLSLTGAAISGIEKDKNLPTTQTLIKLVVDYNVDVNWLLVYKGEMFIKENAAKVSDEFKEIIKLEVTNLLGEYGLKDVIK